MSGHSKWATTKHKKAVIDARRAKSFAKLIKNIEVAAKMGGADLNGNPTLYDAVQKAKKTSVPNDNIDRAIKRGAGLTGESIEYTTIMYEGYGPNGVALLIECLTDNKNRAAAEVRTLMSRNGGTMADPGSVAYNFTRKGVIVVSGEGTTEVTFLTCSDNSGVHWAAKRKGKKKAAALMGRYCSEGQRGLRFSFKAVRPSAKSGCAKFSERSSNASLPASLNESPGVSRARASPRRITSGEDSEIACAIEKARSSNSTGGTTSCTSPHCSASVDPKTRPVNASIIARRSPSARVTDRQIT